MSSFHTLYFKDLSMISFSCAGICMWLTRFLFSTMSESMWFNRGRCTRLSACRLSRFQYLLLRGCWGWFLLCRLSYTVWSFCVCGCVWRDWKLSVSTRETSRLRSYVPTHASRPRLRPARQMQIICYTGNFSPKSLILDGGCFVNMDSNEKIVQHYRFYHLLGGRRFYRIRCYGRNIYRNVRLPRCCGVRLFFAWRSLCLPSSNQ